MPFNCGGEHCLTPSQLASHFKASLMHSIHTGCRLLSQPKQGCTCLGWSNMSTYYTLLLPKVTADNYDLGSI